MNQKIFWLKVVICLLVLFMNNTMSMASWVTIKQGKFFNNGTYYFVGANYWYGGLLYADTIHQGKKRLLSELDFLAKKGVNNLRVFIGFEGDGSYDYRVSPSLQEQAGKYDEEKMKGFDFLLVQAAKRNMKIVFVLTNNWEWSGGLGQYLEWNGYGVPPLPKTADWDWDAYCNYISQFYSCNNCIDQYLQWVKYVVHRKNKFNNKLYKNDATILSWELANEPRPMKEEAVDAYVKWIQRSSDSIKQWDKKHLITIGTEGIISTRMNKKLWQQVHRLPNIDYCTLHLWPKTWQWYDGRADASISDTTLKKTADYIMQHGQWAYEIGKPLVVEEFGLHRDENSFSPNASVNNRDAYYDWVFKIGKEAGVAGYNFWGFAGLPQNHHHAAFMQKGMAYSADPPQEEQGLYSVFKNDESTWAIITKWIKFYNLKAR